MILLLFRDLISTLFTGGRPLPTRSFRTLPRYLHPHLRTKSFTYVARLTQNYPLWQKTEYPTEEYLHTHSIVLPVSTQEP